MSVEIKLYKKEGTYFSQDKQKDVPYTNFYLSINGNNIPIEVKYFPNDKFGGRDPGYSGRMAVMSTFAEFFPEKEDTDKRSVVNPYKVECPKCHKIMRIDDHDNESYYLACDDCSISAFFSKKSGELSFKDADDNDIPF